MKNKFQVEDENGIKKEAEVITSFEYKGNEYLLYSIDHGDNSDILVSRVNIDSEGYANISDIEDETENLEVKNVVKKILSSIE